MIGRMVERCAVVLAVLLAGLAAAQAQNAGLGYGQPSTALEGSRVLKPGAGQLSSLQVNSTGTALFVMLIDAATVPADGAVTPAKVWQLAINSTLSITYADAPLILINGITVVCSSTGLFTKTASATCMISGETR